LFHSAKLKYLCYFDVNVFHTKRFNHRWCFKTFNRIQSMNKRQIFAVVASAMANSAFAQSSLTLFGSVDSSLAYVSAKQQKIIGLTSGARAGSSLSIRGEEKLEGGYKLGFQLRSDVNTDTGGDKLKFGGRLNLSGSFGEFRIGKIYNLLSEIRDTFTVIGGSTHNMISSTTVGSINGSSPDNGPNGISYRTPSLGGFYGRVSYTFGEQVGNDKLGSQIIARAGYSRGPTHLTLGYGLVNAGTDAKGVSYRAFHLGISHRIGSFQPIALYVSERGNSKRMDLYSAGWRFWRGSNHFMMGYTFFHNKWQDSNNSHRLALGYAYSLSKRTDLYCTIAHVRNEKSASRKVATGVGYTATAGLSSSGYEIGLSHKF
jgi:predicted porin